MVIKIEGNLVHNGGKGVQKYDWDKLLNGNQWLLSQGVDFDVFPESFRVTAFLAAKKRGLKITTRSAEDSEGRPAIRIQAYSPDHK